jgi:hypothetical protein
MAMATEFIFDRDITSCKERCRQSADLFNKLQEDSRNRSISTKDLIRFTGNVGEDGVLALALWTLAAHTAQAGHPIPVASIVDACKAVATFTDRYTFGGGASDQDRCLAGIKVAADTVFGSGTDRMVQYLAAQCTDHVGVIAEASNGNVVYSDDHLLVSWRSCFGSSKAELYVCVRSADTGLWVWTPPIVSQNVVPPISSFRAAREAIRNWRGRTLSGELAGSSAIRLCNLLGIEVQGDKGIIHGNHRRSQGFAK